MAITPIRVNQRSRREKIQRIAAGLGSIGQAFLAKNQREDAKRQRELENRLAATKLETSQRAVGTQEENVELRRTEGVLKRDEFTERARKTGASEALSKDQLGVERTKLQLRGQELNLDRVREQRLLETSQKATKAKLPADFQFIIDQTIPKDPKNSILSRTGLGKELLQQVLSDGHDLQSEAFDRVLSDKVKDALQSRDVDLFISGQKVTRDDVRLAAFANQIVNYLRENFLFFVTEGALRDTAQPTTVETTPPAVNPSGALSAAEQLLGG